MRMSSNDRGEVLEGWNRLAPEVAARTILPCCGSRDWAGALAALRPVTGEAELLAASDRVWLGLPEAAWREAFDSHPRIGEGKAPGTATGEALLWSQQEQAAAIEDQQARTLLDEANRNYEKKFGRIFIVCASGRSAREILGILEKRMLLDEVAELQEAAEQQRQITQLRLRRWLGGR